MRGGSNLGIDAGLRETHDQSRRSRTDHVRGGGFDRYKDLIAQSDVMDLLRRLYKFVSCLSKFEIGSTKAIVFT